MKDIWTLYKVDGTSRALFDSELTDVITPLASFNRPEEAIFYLYKVLGFDDVINWTQSQSNPFGPTEHQLEAIKQARKDTFKIIPTSFPFYDQNDIADWVKAPGDYSIVHIREFMPQLSVEDTQTMLTLEKAGKNRTSLVQMLTAKLTIPQQQEEEE